MRKTTLYVGLHTYRYLLTEVVYIQLLEYTYLLLLLFFSIIYQYYDYTQQYQILSLRVTLSMRCGMLNSNWAF